MRSKGIRNQYPHSGSDSNARAYEVQLASPLPACFRVIVVATFVEHSIRVSGGGLHGRLSHRVAAMVRDDFLMTMFGAALVSEGGEVPLDHVESLMREKFEVEFHPLGSNSKDHATLAKYLVANFSDICRVKRASDGHFVVRVSSDYQVLSANPFS